MGKFLKQGSHIQYSHLHAIYVIRRIHHAAHVHAGLVRLVVLWCGQMPELAAAQARALYRAGITNPEALAATPQVDVERALCAWLPHTMQTGCSARAKDARLAAARVGVTGQLGSNAVVRRSAKLLLIGMFATTP